MYNYTITHTGGGALSSQSPQNDSGDRPAKERLFSKVVKRLMNTSRKQVTDVKGAIETALDPEEPRRDGLQDIYTDIARDPHTFAQINIRVLPQLAHRWIIRDRESMKEVPEKSLFIRTPWFYYLAKSYYLSELYGPGLVEINGLSEGEFTGVKLLPRANYEPINGLFYLDLEGEHAVKVEDFENYLFKIGHPEELGILQNVAYDIIFKRAASAAWSEYIEIFGQPLRTAESPSRDPRDYDLLDEALANMYGAAYGVFPPGTKITIHDTKGADGHKLFLERIATANAEISKGINSVTMLSDDGSSKSQSEIHEKVNSQIRLSSQQEFEYWANWEVIPKMQMHGYPIDPRKEEFTHDRTQTISKPEHWKMVFQALRYFEVPAEWITENFGIEIEGKIDRREENGKNELTNKLVNKLAEMGIIERTKPTITKPANRSVDPVNREFPEDLQKLINRILRSVHRSQKALVKELLKKGWEELMNYVSEKLKEGVEEGFGTTLEALGYETEDAEFLTAMLRNVAEFSANKNFALLKKLNELLMDENGKLREWQDFKPLAMDVAGDYNVTWLETEYNQAIANAQNARQWRELRSKKVRVKYVVPIDDHTTNICRRLNGMVFDLDDPILKTIWPGNHWGCRGYFVEVPITTPLSKKKIDTKDMEEIFKLNTGVDGKVFSESHNYYDPDTDTQKGLKELANEKVKEWERTATK